MVSEALDRPAGRHFANFGGFDGPILWGDAPSAIGVLSDLTGPPMPIGIAYAVGHVRHKHRSVVLWRLVVRKEDIPGRWVCIRRVFVAVEDWLEREAIRGENDPYA